jgi:hypothetical protein
MESRKVEEVYNYTIECILGYMSDMSDIWTGAENTTDIHERLLKKKNSRVVG